MDSKSDDIEFTIYDNAHEVIVKFLSNFFQDIKLV